MSRKYNDAHPHRPLSLFPAGFRAGGPKSLDSVFSDYGHPGPPGCAVGVLKDGKFIHQQGYGYANFDYDFPLTSKSVFDIGSPPSSSLPSPFCCSKKTASSRLKIPSANTSRSSPITERPSPSITCLLTPAASAIIWHSANSPVTALTISLPIPKWSPCSPAKKSKLQIWRRISLSNSGYFLVSQIVVRVSGQPCHSFWKHVCSNRSA